MPLCAIVTVDLHQLSFVILTAMYSLLKSHVQYTASARAEDGFDPP